MTTILSAPAAAASRAVLDPERLRVLTETGLLDGPAVDVLDRLTGLATRVLGAPVALVSLVDSGRQFFVSAVGLPEPWAERRQTPHTHSFCQYVVAADAPLIISDARADELLCTNLAIPDIGVIAYAGYPLRSPDGHPLGSFCVIDTKPREWTASDLAVIADLASAAQSEIAVRLSHAQLARMSSALDHERTFLASLLDSLDTGVAACDADGRLVLFNRAMRRDVEAPTTGVPSADWAEQYGLCTADGVPFRAGETPLARAFRGEVVQHADLVVRRSGRADRQYLANAQPIRAADGTRLGAVVALHDVTAAVRTERLRAVQHAVATALTEATSAADAAARTVAAVSNGMGWSSGEYWQLGEGRATLVASTGRPGDGAVALAVGEGGEPLSRERQSDGPGATLGLPVRSGDGLLGVLVFRHDGPLGCDEELLSRLDGVGAYLARFVESRRAQAAWRAFEQVVSSIDDYVWSVEVGPHGEATLLFASPNGARVFGADLYTPDGRTVQLSELVHPDDAESLATFHASVREGRPGELEARFVGRDGVVRWVWTRAVPRRESDRLYIDGICTDITERNRISSEREELLARKRQQIAELRELDRMKDELVALVTHELRSPITSIRGYLELVFDEPEGISPAADHFLRIVDRKAADLQQLTDDLLDMARLDAGEISVDVRPVSLSKLVGDVVTDLRPAAEAKHLTVAVTTDGPVVVCADPARFRQVLTNVVSNAVKYTPDGGQVSIRAANADGVATLDVADTGIGIPADQYPRLFERFFRTSNAVQQGIKGTGLGLAITKAIVERHGGTIAARPGVPCGTVFTITLPASAE
ncbi:ATP-binding protein [Cryptosporangium phraense]|uniref:Sensor-like histidine kinase SenX3 n=1 Tax=Cryptosporangium phraense TaxID=2593070 RepID=A0A545AWI2_9ACTN|nr:ATP-binding protein [Cryptosporangium phraense]TQS45687.1 GAF domain-containing protein [Cryptosporangium phraense]